MAFKEFWVGNNGPFFMDGTAPEINEETQMALKEDITNANVNTIQFNTSATPIASTPGLLQWNANDGTLDLGMPNSITQQIGQETFIFCKNQTGSTVLNGKAVMYEGTIGASGRPKIEYAIADGSKDAHLTIGILTQDILNGEDGFVTTFGKVRGIDTTGTNEGETWAEGDILYVSPTTPGNLTNIMPNAPDLNIPVGIIINAHATMGTILVRASFTSRLTDLADVNGTALTTTGQIPVWNNTSGYFDFTENIFDYFYKPGKSGGQTAYGGSGAGEDLVLDSTSNATKGLVIIGPKVALTPLGGVAVKLVNKTGAASVKGEVVSVSSTTDSGVQKIVIDVPDPFGVIYNSGVADGNEIWVVISGIAEVYYIGDTIRGYISRGFITTDSGYVTGQAMAEPYPTAPFATDKHFYEIGHVLESRVGAGLAKTVLHFN